MQQFLFGLAKGRTGPQQTMEDSSYCIFFSPLEDPFSHEQLVLEGDELVLHLNYGEANDEKPLSIAQVGTNVLICEPESRAFCKYLEEMQPKYLGHVIMYALMYKTQVLSELVEGTPNYMKELEDELDSCLDNSGTYRLLDFRRNYTEYGNQLIALKEILTHIEKGYYPMQMQNSYVLQGKILTNFRFLEERYDLIKNTVIKDFDTYTSIVNNNITRNARLLSVISLVGVILNFFFGSLLAFNPVLGIIGGIVIAGLSIGVSALYHVNKRKPGQRSSRIVKGYDSTLPKAS